MCVSVDILVDVMTKIKSNGEANIEYTLEEAMDYIKEELRTTHIRPINSNQ